MSSPNQRIGMTYVGAQANGHGGDGLGPYANMNVADEFVGVELLDKGTHVQLTVALKPPRPSSDFFVEVDPNGDPYHDVAVGNAHDGIRKHASELRWNCIETFLRADVEHKRLDVKRLRDALMTCLDNEGREALALELMAGVEVVPR